MFLFGDLISHKPFFVHTGTSEIQGCNIPVTDMDVWLASGMVSPKED